MTEDRYPLEALWVFLQSRSRSKRLNVVRKVHTDAGLVIKKPKS